MGDAARGRMEITVTDPVKHSEGINAFVSYKVTTKTDLERFDSNHFYVHRRYSDFVWLQEQLAASYPGIIIPPLPEKHVMRRFNEPFLSQRQRSLEKFLNRVAAHELLRDNRFVKNFLERESIEGMKEDEAREAKKADKSFWQWATAATNSLSSKMTGPACNRPKTDDDLKFDEIKQYVNSLEPQINAVHKHTHSLVEKGKDMAQALFDFGLAFTLLGQAEADALGDAMAQLGQCADKLSRITAVEADKESQFFDEPMKDYVRLVKQVKQTLDVRTAKLAAYESALSDLEAKKQARSRLDGAADVPGHAAKVSHAEEELRGAQEAAEAAREDYELVTKRVFTEMDRFKREKLVDLKSIVLDYVQLQIEYNQQVEQSWRGVLPSLQALSIQQGGLPSAPAADPARPSSQPLSPPEAPAAPAAAATAAASEGPGDADPASGAQPAEPSRAEAAADAAADADEAVDEEDEEAFV